MKRLVVLFAVPVLAVTLAPPALAGPIVPSSSAGVEGDSNNAFPFNTSNMRYQQVYAASQFSGPLLITQILFRPDADSGNAFSATLPNVQIDLSTTSVTPAALSPTFASNIGADNTTVFSGALSISSAFTGPAGGPKAFDIVINLQTPFFYDPAAGNLLLDVRNFSGASTSQFDAISSPGVTNRVYASGVGSTTGTTGFTGSGTYGLITQFNGAPAAVPEPATVAIFGALAIGAFGLRRRAKAA